MSKTTIETLQIELKSDINELKKQIQDAKKMMEQLDKETRETKDGLGDLEDQVDSMKGSFNGLKSCFAGLFTGFVVKQILDVGKSSVQMAMDVVESESLFETSMGNMAGAARQWSEELSQTLGLSATELRKNLGVMYNMTSSMGLSSNTAYDLSTSLVMLAQDMASFYNMDTEEAFTKLRAGITGETEPLKALGILIDENTIKQYAYENGIAEVGEELTNQQKILARYYAILGQTSNAQGDLARTIESPSNQLRIFEAQLEEAKIQLGQGLMPVIQELLPYLIAFAEKISEIVVGLFGIEEASSSIAAGLGSNYDTSGIDAATDSEKELSDAIKETDEALKKSLTSFDEINKIGNSAESKKESSTVGDSSAGLDFDIKTLGNSSSLGNIFEDESLKNAKDSLDDIFDVVKNLSGALIPIIGISAINNFSKLKNLISGMSLPTSKLAKGLIGAGGLVVAFTSTKKAGEELARILNGDDSGSVATAMTSLVTGGIGAVAAGFAFGGPIGGMIAGLSAVTGAIAGVVFEYDEMRREMVNSAFLQNEGLELKELAGYFKETWGEAVSLGNETETAREKIKNSLEEIADARNVLDPYIQKIEDTGHITEVEAENMANAVSSMVDNMQDIVDTRVSQVWETFNSFVELAKKDFTNELGEMKGAFLEFQAIFGDVTDSYETEIKVLLQRATEKDENGNFIGLSEKDRQTLADLTADLESLNVEVTIEESNLESFMEQARKGLKVESVKDAKSIIAEMTELSNAAKDSIESSYEAALANIKTLSLQNERMHDLGKISDEDYKTFADAFSLAQNELKSLKNSSLMNLKSDSLEVARLIKGGLLQTENNMFAERKEKLAQQTARKDDLSGAELKSYLKELINLPIDLKAFEEDILNPINRELEKFLSSFTSSVSVEDLTPIISSVSSGSNWHATGEYTEGGREIIVVKPYANGGFPEDGFFWANSQEMVGKFTNGKTAVANNYQIVEGIKQGVLEAMQSADTSEGGTWIIQIVDVNGAVTSERMITAADRRNRRDGRVTLPLGL